MTEEYIKKTRENMYRSLKVHPESISHELKEFVDFGSYYSKLTMFDLTVYEPSEKRTDRNYNIEELMAHGTKLLDAVIYQNIVHKKKFVFAQNQRQFSISNPSKIGEALFCVFYYLLHYDDTQSCSEKEEIPVFIKDSFKNPKRIELYNKTIASFDIDLLNKTWLKKIKLYEIPFRIKHRMSLGVLGHETMDIFRLFKSDIMKVPRDIKTPAGVYYGMVSIASKGPTWNIFPGTRSVENAYNYEKIECDLKKTIQTVYSNTQLKKMKFLGFFSEKEDTDKTRIIYSQEFDEFNEFIFTNDMLYSPPKDVLSSKFTFPLYFYTPLEEGNKRLYKTAFISFQI